MTSLTSSVTWANGSGDVSKKREAVRHLELVV